MYVGVAGRGLCEVRCSTLGCEGGIIQGFFPLGGSDSLCLPFDSAGRQR